MATPAVAGIAALLREYLLEGNHAKYSAQGAEGSSYKGADPSSALLKALIIGSTLPLAKGYSSTDDTNPVTLSSFYAGSNAVSDSKAFPLGTGGQVDYHQVKLTKLCVELIKSHALAVGFRLYFSV